MAFNKGNNSKVIGISVTHPWHPGVAFVFTFPKTLPQSALDAEKSFLGLTDDERAEKYREGLINTVAEMVAEAPEGFEDFPASVTSGPGSAGLSTKLADRMRVYFDDPDQPELEAILASAWKGYKVAALPHSFLVGGQDRGAAGGVSPSQAGAARS